MDQGHQPHVLGGQPCIQSLLGKGNMTRWQPQWRKQRQLLFPVLRCGKESLIPVILGLCLWEWSSPAHARRPWGGIFMPPNFLTCTAVPLPEFLRGSSKLNFGDYCKWLCIKKLSDISRFAWMRELVEGSTPSVCNFSRQDRKGTGSNSSRTRF